MIISICLQILEFEKIKCNKFAVALFIERKFRRPTIAKKKV